MNYWVQRLAMAVLLLLAVSALTFGAMNVLGDPLFNILGPRVGDTSPEGLALIDAAKAEYNLDQPLPVRYVKWLGGFVTGDFGVQFSNDGQPPVSDLIIERLPRSAMLLVMAQLLATVIAIPWSLWSASKANGAVDKASTFSTFLIIALPNFALAVVLKYLLAIKLGWFPLTFNASDPFLTRVYQMFLPALTISTLR